MEEARSMVSRALRSDPTLIERVKDALKAAGAEVTEPQLRTDEERIALRPTAWSTVDRDIAAREDKPEEERIAARARLLESDVEIAVRDHPELFDTLKGIVG